MDRPNILIFMSDHQRGDTVLPEHRCITPNLDKLCAEGVAFTETFCPTPHCCPSRATFMTGLYPTRHGVWNNICNDMALSRGVKDGVRMWSQDLAEQGYQLYYGGKWHVSVEEGPADRGWNEIGVSSKKGDHHGVPWSRYEEIAREGDPAQRQEAQILRPGYGTYTAYGSMGERTPGDSNTVDRAIEVMPQAAESGKPWCIYAGCNFPHDPYFVPQKYLDMYDLDEVPLPESFADEMGDKPRVYQRTRRTRWGQMSEREYREAIRHFWAMCTYLDDEFGRLLAALDATGQADNTLVLYCSDHGDYCGDHGLFCKGIPAFRGAYHVPAVVRWPAGIRNPGRRVGDFVSLADFGPTFTELCGCTPDPTLTGRSLVPLLRDERPADWRDEIHTQCNGVELYYTQRSVTTKDWKYVFNGFDEDELYDLRNDPHEMVNLANRPEHDAAKRDMCRRMWAFAHRENDAAINPYITVSLAPYGPAEAFR